VHFSDNRYFRIICLSLLVVIGTSVSERLDAADHRDMLLHAITYCLDAQAPEYCTLCLLPRVESSCARGRGCKDTLEIWEVTADYVVMRDRKMCGCANDLVHGLVLPRTRVAGIEDPRRPGKIWSYAWGAARKRIKEESEIALAVNPQGNRSQDQLHIHIVRLLADIHSHFSSARMTKVQSLDEVWHAAEKTAEAAHLKDYGVLVAKDQAGGFLVLVDDRSLEKTFTQWGCR